MNSNQKISLIVILVAGAFLAIRASQVEFGKVYSTAETVEFSEEVQKDVGDSVKPWTNEKVISMPPGSVWRLV